MTDKRKSQVEQIEAYLLAGHTITQLEAFEKFRCFRLAAVIYTLRERHKIEAETIESNGKRFARYKLIPEPQLRLAI